jgi:DNA-directed RNA polymerase subunit RPC12/RpoP
MQADLYSCRNCGSSVQFNIPTGLWRCQHCQEEFSKDQLTPVQSSGGKTFDNDTTENPVPDSQFTEYHCSNCGANVLAEENTSATFCLYCKSPAILSSRFSNEFRPQYLLPFKITQAKAIELYNEWIKKRFFAPRAFKSSAEAQTIRGLYAPYWLFNCAAKGKVEGEGRKVRSFTRGDYHITETKHYFVQREGLADYEKIPADGSKQLDDDLVFGIEPYDYSDLQAFSLQYMSGVFAEKFDVDSAEAETKVRPKAESFFYDRLQQTIEGYSSFSPALKQAEISELKADYALLPLYILTNIWKNKKLTFLINGQTGKIYGQTPIDGWWRFIFFLLLSAGFWVLGILVGGVISAW